MTWASDDDTGWTEILVGGWGPLVRDAAVGRVERATVGRRGVLVRALTEEPSSRSHAACVEEVHELVVEAIRVETGADLDELGSQAAWACYEDVWARLQSRWADGGSLVAVAPTVLREVEHLVRLLPAIGAEHAGADVGEVPYRLLDHAGQTRVDVDGLFAWVALDRGEVSDGDRALVDRVVTLVRGEVV